MNYLKISWWNDTDLGEILYQDGYKNVIYLDVEVEKPEYNVTLESDLNGDNVEITKFRKWEKVYKFELWCQEDLVDAFTLMQIHDNVEVTLQSGDVIQVAKHGLRVEPKWEEIGCLCQLTVSFAENYIVAGNCTENMDQECYCTDLGEFSYIDDGTAPASPDRTIALIYSVANNPGKWYTAVLKEAQDYVWLPIAVPEQYSCYTNLDDSSTWIFDGQFWHKVPGYIYSSSLLGGFDVEITGWILPGTFAIVWYNAGIGWVNAGTFTADEISAGVTVEIVGSGNIPVRLEVYNHSCNYNYSDNYTVTMPTPLEMGLLYNWYAGTDARNIANTGWHMPTSTEFITLQTYLGGESVAGDKMKKNSSIYWQSPFTATNTSKFSAKGSGYRQSSVFSALKQNAQYWAYNQINATVGWYAQLGRDVAYFTVNSGTNKFCGESIRLLKDSTILSDGETGTYTGNDGTVYDTICIGTQEWLSENLKETKYRNGESIPEVTDVTAWNALVTGALCAYDNDRSYV